MRYLAEPALDADARRKVALEQCQFLDGRAAERVADTLIDDLARVTGRSRRGPAIVRVTYLMRCLAMMRGGGETQHLAWMRALTRLGVEIEVITGRPLLASAVYPPEVGSRDDHAAFALHARTSSTASSRCAASAG